MSASWDARYRVLAVLADYGIHPHSERERMVDALVNAVRLGDVDVVPAWHQFTKPGPVVPGDVAVCGWVATASWLNAEQVAPTMRNTCPTCLNYPSITTQGERTMVTTVTTVCGDAYCKSSTCTRYTAWSGYTLDHHFEDDEVSLTWEDARASVIQALEEEGEHASAEADTAGDANDYHEWTGHAVAYQAALELLQRLEVGASFDVTIHAERFAILPEDPYIAEAKREGELLQRRIEEGRCEDWGDADAVLAAIRAIPTSTES